MSRENGGDAGECAPFGPGSFDIALLSAGGVLKGVDAVLDGKVNNAYCLVRPPGHHAERDQGRGFCLLSNVAIAAFHALEARGLSRISIIDWDVHHGNGTQQAFYADPRVMFVSIHQDRNYPVDSGSSKELGEGAGRGYNLNIPLPPGCGHGAYMEAIAAACRVAEAHRPELVLVSCGFDPAWTDPLGAMMCHSGTFREMTRMAMGVAERCCGGKIVLAHEGGYSEAYTPFCGLAVVEALAGRKSGTEDPWLGEYSMLGQQEAQPHQVAAVRDALQALEAVRPGASG